MLGIYLSGTGNTKHCMEKLVSLLDASAEIIPIEQEDAAKKVAEQKRRRQISKKAITLVGKEVVEQCRFENYI